MNDLTARFELARPGFTLEAGLEAPAGITTALFGPSGSGKTTLLRCLAGLEPQARGFVQVGEAIWQDDARGLCLPVHRRAVGYVFQDARLFPHLDVAQNLDYGRRRAAGSGPALGWDEIVELLGLGTLLRRLPHQLSGGEQQRVAIGRALLCHPRLLLLDEPLAALDRQRKAEILPYLERLHGLLAIPMVYVSHQVDEITRLADHLVLIDAGRVQAAGPLAALLARLDLPLAQADDAVALLETRIVQHDDAYHLTQVAFDGGELLLARQPHAVGTPLRVLVHARDVSLALTPAADSSILNILAGHVVEIRPHGPGGTTVSVQVGAARLLARVTRKSCDRLGLTLGTRVWAQVKSVALAE